MAVLYSCMSWTSATSIGPRPAHPSGMRIRVRATSDVCESRPGREHPESTGLFRSHQVASDLLGKNSSPRPGHLSSSYTIPLSFYFSEFAHCLRADRGHGGVHFLKRKPAYSAQFLCSVSPFTINTCKSVSKQRTSTAIMHLTQKECILPLP